MLRNSTWLNRNWTRCKARSRKKKNSPTSGDILERNERIRISLYLCIPACTRLYLPAQRKVRKKSAKKKEKEREDKVGGVRRLWVTFETWWNVIKVARHAEATAGRRRGDVVEDMAGTRGIPLRQGHARRFTSAATLRPSLLRPIARRVLAELQSARMHVSSLCLSSFLHRFPPPPPPPLAFVPISRPWMERSVAFQPHGSRANVSKSSTGWRFIIRSNKFINLLSIIPL